ncbi:MAG TPA: signal peptidase I [Elusimicrobia bacterium]|nr:signal peptidase I [Elusimicrobiota bacterium]HBT60360.1 signal peptidase I [Elusimicrobiota bacterium]
MAVFFLLVCLAVAILTIAGTWQVFVKAGKPGWGCLIPIYNLYLMIKIAGRPGWWLILACIPLINLIVLFILPFDIARNFGRSASFGLGLLLLPFVFYPVLGLGDAQYLAPSPGTSA